MYLIEPLVFLTIALIMDAAAMETRSVFFSLIATIAPLWELGQVAATGYSNLIVSVAYDSGSSSFKTLTIANPDWLLVALALAVVIGAAISISLSIGGKKAPE